MEDVPIEITDEADERDETALRTALHAFNVDQTGFVDGRSLSCFLRGTDDVIYAGVDGFTWGGYARVDVLWVSSDARGRGLGSRLLAVTEDEARARGCRSIILETHSFQAPDFYRSRGYVEVGATRDTPLGHAQLLFQKRLLE